MLLMLLLEEKGDECRREELLEPIYLFHENVEPYESLIDSTFAYTVTHF